MLHGSRGYSRYCSNVHTTLLGCFYCKPSPKKVEKTVEVPQVASASAEVRSAIIRTPICFFCVPETGTRMCSRLRVEVYEERIVEVPEIEVKAKSSSLLALLCYGECDAG